VAKYLIKAKYTLQGTKGLLKEGGSSRRAAVKQMLEGLGGKMEAFYYAFGETDVFLIVDIPDAQSAAALSLVVNASGGAEISITSLLTPEDIDVACKKSVTYRAPGT
jgi:uncharacterized protein with GYD domain